MAAARSIVKTNERPGTRAQVRYVRMSASKARVVLDLIRGKHVGEASQILAFSERLVATVIMKCLRSAVANAEHNDDIPAEELYVSACYADEGPTLKRYRPRARGRAGRIHKQTCHITIVVSRYDEDDLDELRRRAEERGSSQASSSSADRRRRVARSRAADTEASEPEDTVEETAEDTDTEADTASPAAGADAAADIPAATEVADEGVAEEAPEDSTDDVPEDATSSDEERSDDGAAESEETT
ncbi:MAG: 50S ribosomal protein L22 [Acidimicrobiia bacterium]|nr:50S ribosomal protein L22 [Acidimicrobiia bacterium]